MRKVIKRQRTIVGRLQREVARKMTTLSKAIQDTLGQTSEKAKRLVTQTASRKAIEPIIGHLNADHSMDRCHLKGAEGDALHAVLCAAGYFHPLAAADDRPERPRHFVAPAAGARFDGLICEIGRNLRFQPTAKLRSTPGTGLK